MNGPIIAPDPRATGSAASPMAAFGSTLAICECSGSGPDDQHVHYREDEAWHVLEGTLTFLLGDEEVKVKAGTTVFVPAGVAHTWREDDGPARYLIIMPRRLSLLVDELHKSPAQDHASIMRRFDTEIVTTTL